jgi:hypothetical protein
VDNQDFRKAVIQNLDDADYVQAISKTINTSYASVQGNLTKSRGCYTPALCSPSRLLFVWSL